MFPLAMMAGSALLSAAGTASGISSKNKATQKQQQALRAQQEAQLKRSEVEQRGIQQQIGEELTNLEREAISAASSIEAQQAGTGLSGPAAMRARGNVFMQEAIQAGSIVSKGESALISKGISDIATTLRAKGAINQLESQKTSGLSAALAIGKSAVGGAMSGYSMGTSDMAKDLFK